MSYRNPGGTRASSTSRDRKPGFTGFLVMCLCVGGGATGCKSVDTTPPLFASANLPVTLTEFRIRLNDFAEYFVAYMEDATEKVIDTADDQGVRRHAMEFRLRTVNMFLNSLNQTDPVASLIDAWAFCRQLEDFVEGELGTDLFGPHQAIVVDAVRQVNEEVERVIEAVTARPATQTRTLVNAWADEHPFRSNLMVRGSTAVLLAEQLETQDNSAFAALGRLQSGVDDIVAQLQRYISIMPRTIRWQSQLIVHETLYDELNIGESMEDRSRLDHLEPAAAEHVHRGASR